MSDKRSQCPISCALDLFGDRWTLLVLRDILFRGKRRFNDFLNAGEGIASNILAERLRRLEAGGVLKRERDPDDKRQYLYSVTEKGAALVRALLEIAFWGVRYTDGMEVPEGFAENYEADRDGFTENIIRKLSNSKMLAND